MKGLLILAAFCLASISALPREKRSINWYSHTRADTDTTTTVATTTTTTTAAEQEEGPGDAPDMAGGAPDGMPDLGPMRSGFTSGYGSDYYSGYESGYYSGSGSGYYSGYGSGF